MHYHRQRRMGDVNSVRVGHRYTEIDPAARLASRSKRKGQCIVYTAGHPTRSGHRLMGFRGRYVGVHRVAQVYNVSQYTIWRIARGRGWTHVLEVANS